MAFWPLRFVADPSIEPGSFEIREPCSECGGDCHPECGLHPMGCAYGGWSDGYWMAVLGCPLDHGDSEAAALRSDQHRGHRLLHGGSKIDKVPTYLGPSLLT